MLLNRTAMINSVEPDVRSQAQLYTDDKHFHSEAYHAFNWQLLESLPPLPSHQAPNGALRKGGFLLGY